MPLISKINLKNSFHCNFRYIKIRLEMQAIPLIKIKIKYIPSVNHKSLCLEL